MNRNKVIALALVGACGLLIVGSALAGDSFAIPRHVFSGGGERLVGDGYILDATLGEAIAGNLVVGDSFQLGSGYWWPPGGEENPPGVNIYLPVVMRSDG